MKKNKLTEELLIKYKPLVKSIARGYFLVGGETDDLVQEGMIGLYTAITNYDAEKNSDFEPFAAMCIRRQIISAVRKYTNLRALPLSNYASLIELDKDTAVESPENLFIQKEEGMRMSEQLKNCLSTLEKRVLELYLEGCRYSEIAAKLDTTEKTVNNALQRIRKKILIKYKDGKKQ